MLVCVGWLSFIRDFVFLRIIIQDFDVQDYYFRGYDMEPCISIDFFETYLS